MTYRVLVLVSNRRSGQWRKSPYSMALIGGAGPGISASVARALARSRVMAFELVFRLAMSGEASLTVLCKTWTLQADLFAGPGASAQGIGCQPY